MDNIIRDITLVASVIAAGAALWSALILRKQTIIQKRAEDDRLNALVAISSDCNIYQQTDPDSNGFIFGLGIEFKVSNLSGHNLAKEAISIKLIHDNGNLFSRPTQYNIDKERLESKSKSTPLGLGSIKARQRGIFQNRLLEIFLTANGHTYFQSYLPKHKNIKSGQGKTYYFKLREEIPSCVFLVVEYSSQVAEISAKLLTYVECFSIHLYNKKTVLQDVQNSEFLQVNAKVENVILSKTRKLRWRYAMKNVDISDLHEFDLATIMSE